jgi:hypothetical protein
MYTTLEAPMEKTQGTIVAGRCPMVSFQGLKARTVESISDIWSSALRSASFSKLAASTGAFSSGTLLSKIFSSSLGCFFTYLKTVLEAALKIVGVL